MTRRALALWLALAGLSCGPHLSPPGVTRSQVSAQIEGDAPAAFAAMVGASERVLRVAERLRTANTARCGEKVGSDLGWIAWSDRDFRGHTMRALAQEFLQVRGEPVVVALAPDGAAAHAGVRVGDHVQEVGEHGVSNGRGVARAERDLAATGTTVALERDGAALELPVEPARACGQPVVPVDAEGIVAVPIEGQIAVTFRLVEVASDDELAFALAHALAMDLLEVEARDFIPEPKTTRLAVELSQRAGFSVDDVEGLLELQAIEQPGMVMRGRPDEVKVGEIPRRIVALRMVRAGSPGATHATP